MVWTNVGSTNEYEEMAVRLPSPRHRIFRDLDPRRYSMHFNRWSAFQQAKDFERRHNISYSWFVHSRLDMAVGQPLPSYSSYSPFQVFVPDLWFSDVPDTFALIPATYSDAYFSMDVMVEKGNMCLGGPNFDLSSATPSSLKTRFNYSVAMINEVQLCLCRTTQEGFSEQILRRKLASKGISLWAKTLVFTSFFLVVVRKDWRNYCEFLRPDFFIGWLLKSQAANTALYPACLLMIKDLQREEAAPSCTPLSIAPIALSTNNSNTSPQKSAIYNSNCLLNKAKSDWNFMPLRIQRPRASGGGCLTLSPSSPSSKDADKKKDGLRMKPCIAHEIVSFDTRVNGSYSISQLFFFHPLDANAQTVRHLKYSNTRNEHLCLTISGDESGKALSSQLKGRMESCRTVHNDDQLIQVMLYGRRKKVKKFSAAVSTQGGSMVAEAQPILRVKEYVSFIKRGKCLLHSKTSEEVVWGECPTKKKFSSRGGKKRRERAIGREQRRLSEEGLGGGGDNSMIGGSNSAGAVPTDHVFIIERTST